MESLSDVGRITLRNTRVEDIDFVLGAERDAENAPYVGQWSRDEHLRSLIESDLSHQIIHTGDGRRVGYTILAGLENQNRALELRRIVITDKGKGYGRAALLFIKKLAFETLGVHRLWLDVRENNPRALHLYKALGFQAEGTLRECIYLNGEYCSLIVLSILESEYL
ncbi:RimJ/RimL family protein N-acetyltransferase [Hydrogenispora ethanolica]|jgi:RimJ/RimL family protein N-acetyltransferase|uniref:RimJ/RimL family protein N-acetyltransferase n=1 Tax=Hydrogenispora ethanolica TaxID=1082276 RepID=A0A4R1RRE7_HYDET|nr:GNAT family protein [Hydrogenispora ethanolica]TCL68512.1 RimJ/RimL family protein N-acetyltransferase [Hydrogenispora ethanolica]